MNREPRTLYNPQGCTSPRSSRPADAASGSAPRSRSSCCRSADADPRAQRRGVSRASGRATRSSSRCRAELAGEPPAYLPALREAAAVSSPAARGGRTRWRTLPRCPGANRRDRHSRCRAAVRERRSDRADDCGRGRIGRRPGAPSPRATRSSRSDGIASSRATLDRARRSSSRRRRRRSGATCCATRWRSATATTRPTRRRSPSAPAMPVRIVEGEATNIKITTPDDLRDRRSDRAARRGGTRRPARDRRVGHRLRPASARRGPAADPRRRDDSVRARRCSATRTPTSSATR